MWYARILFVVLVIGLGYSLFKVEEAFQAGPAIDTKTANAEIEKKYKEFIHFYNPFMETWQKAITTAVGLERPAPNEGDPIPSPTRDELNTYVRLLSQKLDTPLPFVTDPFPDSFTPGTIETIRSLLEATPVSAFQSATDWMNARIKESHEKMGGALKGEGFRVEGFASSDQCAAFASCLDDPAFLERLAAAQAKQSAKEKGDIVSKMNQLIGNTGLQRSLQTNASLRSESDRIQNQAQSGDMLNSMDLPIDDLASKYTLPEGADALEKMKKNDPEKYKQYQTNQKSYVEMKQLFDQISRNLR
jgi:hypothetical protein